MNSDSGNRGARAFAVIFEPLRDYWYGLVRCKDPDSLATFLESTQMMSSAFFKYILGGTITATIAAKVLHYEHSGLEVVGIPILDDLINLLVQLILGLISGLMLHKPLRLAGGKGTFHHTAVASVYVSVAFLFPGVILYWGFKQLNLLEAASFVAGCISMPYLSIVLAKLHLITRRRALTVLFITVVGLSIIGAVVLMFIKEMFVSQINRP